MQCLAVIHYGMDIIFSGSALVREIRTCEKDQQATHPNQRILIIKPGVPDFICGFIVLILYYQRSLHTVCLNKIKSQDPGCSVGRLSCRVGEDVKNVFQTNELHVVEPIQLDMFVKRQANGTYWCVGLSGRLVGPKCCMSIPKSEGSYRCSSCQSTWSLDAGIMGSCQRRGCVFMCLCVQEVLQSTWRRSLVSPSVTSSSIQYTPREIGDLHYSHSFHTVLPLWTLLATTCT